MHSRGGMSTAIVVFESRHGQTEKIARRLAAVLASLGVDAEALPLAAVRRRPLTAELVVVGSPVHAGKHLPGTVAFVRERRAELERGLSAFFSVSLARTRDPAEADGYVAALLAETGWKPLRSAAFAGALPYRRYNFLMRWMMRRISASHGGETDTSRDHEYTDWGEVERFGRMLALLLRPPLAQEVADEEMVWPAS